LGVAVVDPKRRDELIKAGYFSDGHRAAAARSPCGAPERQQRYGGYTSLRNEDMKTW